MSLLPAFVWPNFVWTALAVAGLLLAAAIIASNVARTERTFFAKLARHRANRLNEMLRTVRLAEDLSGIGVWEYDTGTGEQRWSEGMRRIFGLPEGERFLEGDAETLLFVNNIDLLEIARERRFESAPYTLNFDILGYGDVPRAISVKACNLALGSGPAGPSRVVAIVSDITHQVQRERRLEDSRDAAEREASKAREMAETDPLTGLANRRRVMDQLNRMIVEVRTTNLPMVLVVFDIDHFKGVNDTHGHIEGDRVLKNVARIAEEQCRDGDVIGRVGGEEFVWAVAGVSDSIGRIMSERLRQAVAAGSATAKAPAVTISAGVAELRPGDTSLTVFARADGALYQAKNAGRNRVRLAA